jgi:hypothetical protein
MSASAIVTADHAAIPSRESRGTSEPSGPELLTAIRDYRDSFDCELEAERADDREHDVEDDEDREPSRLGDRTESATEEEV